MKQNFLHKKKVFLKIDKFNNKKTFSAIMKEVQLETQ